MMVSSLPSDYLWENLSYYQIPLHRDSGFYNILLLTLNVSQDIEESIMQQFQCREIIQTAAERLSGLLVFQDIHMNLVLLTENRKINLYNYGFHFSTLLKDKLGIKSYVASGRRWSASRISAAPTVRPTRTPRSPNTAITSHFWPIRPRNRISRNYRI